LILGTTKLEANIKEPWFETYNGTITSKGVRRRILQIATVIALGFRFPFALTRIRVHVVHVLVRDQLYELPVHLLQVLLHLNCTGMDMGIDEITRVLFAVSQQQQ
jgi:hypothetical protein